MKGESTIRRFIERSGSGDQVKLLTKKTHVLLSVMDETVLLED